MTEILKRKRFDLEDRTTVFAKAVIRLCKKLQKDVINKRIIDQVIGAAGSVGANYREANDSLGKKDFLQRLRISRREAKEAQHWLCLLMESNPEHKSEISLLTQEVQELRNILSAIITKSE